MAETAAAIATFIGASASTAASVGKVVTGIGSVASSVAPVVGVASSLASAGLAISGSREQAAALTSQAQQQDLIAQQERLRGQESANQVREALLRSLASQRASYAAAGVTLDGTPETVAEWTRYEAERELTIQAGNTANRVATAEASRDILTTRAASTRTAGIGNAAISLFDAADRIGRRAPGRTTP